MVEQLLGNAGVFEVESFGGHLKGVSGIRCQVSGIRYQVSGADALRRLSATLTLTHTHTHTHTHTLLLILLPRSQFRPQLCGELAQRLRHDSRAAEHWHEIRVPIP